MTNRLVLDQLEFGYTTGLTPPLSFRLAAGEIASVLGPSGSGKSTLLATIAGIQPPLAGTIAIDGVDVTHTPIHRRGIGLVFQDPLLFAHLSVLANVKYGLRRHGVSNEAATLRARELLEWVGLEGLEPRSVHELSGGQAQRVALARALAPEPAVLLLDEPFSALDAPLRERLAIDIVELARRTHAAVLHVTHDEAEAERMGDHAIKLQ